MKQEFIQESEELLPMGTSIDLPHPKKSADPLLRYWKSQAILCIIGIILFTIVRFAVPAAYSAFGDWYRDHIAVTLSPRELLSQFSSSSTAEKTEEAGEAVETMAPVTATEPAADGFDDSADDSVALPQTEWKAEAVNAFMLPVSGRITSGFGYRTHPIYGTKLFHNGVDIGAETDTPIAAAMGGTVATAEYHESYGNYVIIDHGSGLYTLYAHCNKLLVKAGETVEKGQKIAKVGSTGVATGPHLHFEVRSGEYRVDPTWLLNFS